MNNTAIAGTMTRRADGGRRIGRRTAGLAGALALAAAVAGCRTVPSSQPEENIVVPRSSEAVVITVVGNETTLTWPTQPGYAYSVVYRDSLNAPWQTLAGQGDIAGTGGTMTLRIPTPPGSPNRRYNVRGVPTKGARAAPAPR